jgi:hypothetical protein
MGDGPVHEEDDGHGQRPQDEGRRACHPECTVPRSPPPAQPDSNRLPRVLNQ